MIVNLYPFQRLAGRRDIDESELVENIDIGGPAMLRAAAKNFRDVAVVCDPERYGFVLSELDDNGLALSLPTRRELAAEAFAHTAGYDATIANWFTEAVDFPDRLFVEMVKHTELPYGENPHQRAAYYAERGARRHVLSMVHQHGGRGVTFNNIADISAGRDIAREFTLPVCVIIKHTNPCGVAMGARIEDAFANALKCDPQSAFGGVIVMNRPVTLALARDARRALRRGHLRARLRRGRRRAAGEEAEPAHPRDARAAAVEPGRARPAPGARRRCSCRTTTRSPRTAT